MKYIDTFRKAKELKSVPVIAVDNIEDLRLAFRLSRRFNLSFRAIADDKEMELDKKEFEKIRDAVNAEANKPCAICQKDDLENNGVCDCYCHQIVKLL